MRRSLPALVLAAMLGLTPELVGDRRRVDFSKKS